MLDQEHNLSLTKGFCFLSVTIYDNKHGAFICIVLSCLAQFMSKFCSVYFLQNDKNEMEKRLMKLCHLVFGDRSKEPCLSYILTFAF